MFDVYLPVAQQSIAVSILASVGLCSGFLSGLYGIGGGIVAVPIMMFAGIPTNVAIATSFLQMMGTLSANIARNIGTGNIKYSIGIKIGIFGIIGSFIGSTIFISLQNSYIFQPMIYILYMSFIFIVSIFIISDVFMSIIFGELKQSKAEHTIQNIAQIRDFEWEKKLDEFERYIINKGLDTKITTKLRRSIYNRNKHGNSIKSVFIGIIIGIISGLMGVGGGFISFPAIMYLFRQNAKIASVTSALVGLIVIFPSCIIQMYNNNTVDPILATTCAIFSVFGVRFGNKLASKINPTILKLIFSLILLYIGSKFAMKIFVLPSGYEISRL